MQAGGAAKGRARANACILAQAADTGSWRAQGTDTHLCAARSADCAAGAHCHVAARRPAGHSPASAGKQRPQLDAGGAAAAAALAGQLNASHLAWTPAAAAGVRAGLLEAWWTGVGRARMWCSGVGGFWAASLSLQTQ